MQDIEILRQLEKNLLAENEGLRLRIELAKIVESKTLQTTSQNDICEVISQCRDDPPRFETIEKYSQNFNKSIQKLITPDLLRAFGYKSLTRGKSEVWCDEYSDGDIKKAAIKWIEDHDPTGATKWCYYVSYTRDQPHGYLSFDEFDYEIQVFGYLANKRGIWYC